MTPPPVKVKAMEHGIPVYQPASMRDGEALKIFNEIKPDVGVVIAYGKILPQDILDAPKYGCINVHASLLPKYRGAAPIQWSVIDGEPKTGVTTMQMDAGLDTGDMLMKCETTILPDENARRACEGRIKAGKTGRFSQLLCKNAYQRAVRG